MTTTAMTVYKKRLPAVIDVRALPARRKRSLPEPLAKFLAWIEPVFRKQFEDDCYRHLQRDTRAAYKQDREFRALVNRGQNVKAKAVLWDIIGVMTG